jgi:hypothetical protein
MIVCVCVFMCVYVFICVCVCVYVCVCVCVCVYVCVYMYLFVCVFVICDTSNGYMYELWGRHYSAQVNVGKVYLNTNVGHRNQYDS